MNTVWWIRSGRYGISGPHSTTQMKKWSDVLVNSDSYISTARLGPFIPVRTRFPDPIRLFETTSRVTSVSFKHGISGKSISGAVSPSRLQR